MTGIGEYTLRLIEALLEQQDVTELYGHSRIGPRRLLAPPGVRGQPGGEQPKPLVKTTLRRARRLTDMLVKRAVLQRMSDVVYHEPNYLPAAFDGPTVVTVHDLSHIHYAACHPKARVMALERLLPRALNRASAVIAVSQCMADEICQQYGLPPDRVHVVHHGVDPMFCLQSPAAIAPVLASYGLRAGEYLLSIATLEPRKNLQRLIDAYMALPVRRRQRLPLVLAGAPGWRNRALRERIDRLVCAGELRYLGYIPGEHRPALYAGARAFAYPALYEGFGLPPLEAMACGTPVLTSDCSAMPEVAGEAALTVNPRDVEAIREALQRLCEDDILRQQLGTAGHARAAGFTWARCAKRTAAVYEKAVT
jgi:alpha-1,3-rhamnosyl/mannosyltransferase